MDNDTILLVFGDHGMTRTGDHGGDSIEEVTSALFVYSPGKPLVTPIYNSTTEVYQIDIVPTISTLLGIPVPFSNIGTLIIDLVLPFDNSAPWDIGVQMFLNNIVQVRTYIQQYSKYFGQLPTNELQALEDVYQELKLYSKSVNDVKSFSQFIQRGKNYLSVIKDICTSVWVRFDTGYMWYGLCIIMFTNLLNIMIILQRRLPELGDFCNKTTIALVFLVGFLGSGFSRSFIGTDTVEKVGIVFTLCLLIVIVMVVFHKGVPGSISKCCDFYGFLLLLPCLYVLSNSYVIEEANVTIFLTLSGVWYYVWSMNASDDSDKISRNNFVNISKRKCFALGVAFVLSILLYISRMYWRCREELQYCEPSNVHKPLSSLPETMNVYKNWRYFTTLVIMALFVTLYRMWLRTCGNLNGFNISVIIAQYVGPVKVVCISAYWALRELPVGTETKLFLWQKNLFAQISVIFIMFSLVIVIIKPLCIYVVTSSRKPIVVNEDALIPSLFNHLKQNWQQIGKSKQPPLVYGLGTVYSATVIMATMLLTLLLCLVLGDGMAVSGILAAMAAFFMASVLGIARTEKDQDKDEILYVPWPCVVCWCFLGSYFFYGTGHQPTFPTIPWEAAFVGNTGNFTNYFLPALSVVTNVFTAQIIYSFALPLVILAPLTNHIVFPAIGFSGDLKVTVQRGELTFWEFGNVALMGLLDLVLKYLLFHGIKLFGCAFAATLHRRHLMVWKIFAPRFIFEGISMLVLIPVVFLSFLFFLRIHSAVRTFMKSVETGGIR